MSLTETLKALLLRRSTPARKAAYEDLVSRLYQAESAKHALKPGDRAPAFLLPNAEGELVASDALLRQGVLVVTFFRGGWCPYCNLTMRAMQAVLPELERAGGVFAGIWPETGGLALRTKRDCSFSFQLLVDVDNSVAMQFGVVFRLPDLYRQVLIEQGFDLALRQGNPGWMLPMPATYIIASDGVIRYAFVDGDFTHRAEPAEIIAVVKALVAEGPAVAAGPC